VVGTWTVLVVLGWTLVYWPHIPESFVLDTGPDPARGGLPDANAATPGRLLLVLHWTPERH